MPLNRRTLAAAALGGGAALFRLASAPASAQAPASAAAPLTLPADGVITPKAMSGRWRGSPMR